MTQHTLTAEAVSLGYGDEPVVVDLDFEVPQGRISVIVGANGCGKSTFLRGLARLLRPQSGRVLLDGVSVQEMRTIEVARILGLLPQSPMAPDGITVGDLVARGRHPHQGWFRRWDADDEHAVATALAATDISDLTHRRIAELSGGQRQRVWVAMALAQETDVLLLDEPTTFLDVHHQIELLDLLVDLNRDRGTTIVLVLHDLNLAFRYAHHVVVLKAGSVIAEGSPADVVTSDVIADAFSLDCEVITDPISATPLVVPRGRHHSRQPD